jgi:hypothetical protein
VPERSEGDRIADRERVRHWVWTTKGQLEAYRAAIEASNRRSEERWAAAPDGTVEVADEEIDVRLRVKRDAALYFLLAAARSLLRALTWLDANDPAHTVRGMQCYVSKPLTLLRHLYEHWDDEQERWLLKPPDGRMGSSGAEFHKHYPTAGPWNWAWNIYSGFHHR